MTGKLFGAGWVALAPLLQRAIRTCGCSHQVPAMLHCLLHPAALLALLLVSPPAVHVIAWSPGGCGTGAWCKW